MDPRAHAVFRFGFGVTLALIVSIVAGWTPAFLPAVFTIVLLANIPICPPPKIAIGFCAILAVSVLIAMLLSYAMRGSPGLLFLLCTLVIFHCLYLIARGVFMLPPLMIMVCVAIFPVFSLQSMEFAGSFAQSFALGGVVAVLAVWISYLIWPKVMPPRKAPNAVPLPPPQAARMALLGISIVAPLVLAYQMLGLTDVMPVLVSTIIVVATLDVHLGRKTAVDRVMANIAGGIASIVILMLLAINPNLLTMALLVILVSLGFGWRITRGDKAAPVVITAFISFMIVFGSSLLSDGNSLSIWLMRVWQFVVAGLFTIGMMALLWPRKSSAPSIDPSGVAT